MNFETRPDLGEIIFLRRFEEFIFLTRLEKALVPYRRSESLPK